LNARSAGRTRCVVFEIAHLLLVLRFFRITLPFCLG
jgi:hypothetical protein